MRPTRVRAHRLVGVDPLERYREAVWTLRRDGEIDAEEALTLILSPPRRVLEQLAAQVAA